MEGDANDVKYLESSLPEKLSKKKKQAALTEMEANFRKATATAKEKASKQGAVHKQQRQFELPIMALASDGKDDFVGMLFFTFKIYPKDNKTPFFKEYPVPWASSHMPTADELSYLSDVLKVKITDESGFDSAEELPKERKQDIHKVNHEAPLTMDRLARDQHPLRTSGFDYHFDDRRGRCTIDFMLDFVRNTATNLDCCKTTLTDEEIAALMTGGMGVCGTSSFLKPTEANFARVCGEHHQEISEILHAGASARNMAHVAAYIGCTLYMLDQDHKTVFTHEAHAGMPRKHNKSMVFSIFNNHIHKVTSQSLIQSVAQRNSQCGGCVRDPKVAGHAWNGTSGDLKSKCTITYIIKEGLESAEDREHLLLDTIRTRQLLPHKVWVVKDVGITSIKYFDDPSHKSATVILINPNNKVANLICRRHGADERPDNTLGMVRHKLFEQFLSKKMKSSRPNPITQQWMLCLNAKNNVHHGTFTQATSTESLLRDMRRGVVQVWDMVAAHPSILYSPMSRWMVIDHNAFPQPYDGTPIQELKLGLYYVETMDRLILNGNRPYIREELQCAAQRKVPFKIISMVLATSSLPKDLFCEYVEKVIELTHPFDLPEGVDEDDMKAARKSLLNSSAGMLGKGTETHMGGGMVTEEVNDVWGFANARVKDTNQQLYRRELHDNKSRRTFHLFALQTKQVMLDHYIPMYLQIQGQLSVLMTRMREALGGMPMEIKTDAWMLKHCTPPDALPTKLVQFGDRAFNEDPFVDMHVKLTLSNMGSYKQQKRPLMTRELRVCDTVDVPLSVPDWMVHEHITDSAQVDEVCELLNQTGGLLVKAEAGCGKTTLAKGVMKKYPSVIALAPTHKASNNLGGCTTMPSWVLPT